MLRPGGTAVIHDSGARRADGWRSPMSATLFASLAADRGLEIQRQFSTWGDGRVSVPVEGRGHDVISVLRLP